MNHFLTKHFDNSCDFEDIQRILKANLSWTRKKVELEWCKNFFVCVLMFLFCT